MPGVSGPLPSQEARIIRSQRTRSTPFLPNVEKKFPAGHFCWIFGRSGELSGESG